MREFIENKFDILDRVKYKNRRGICLLRFQSVFPALFGGLADKDRARKKTRS